MVVQPITAARHAAILLLLGSGPALAQTSAYSELPGASCRPTQHEGVTDCAGPAGFVLRIDGGHASDFVSLRRPGREEVQVRPPEGPHALDGISGIGQRAEWRLAGGQPYALILRRNVTEVMANDRERRRSRLEVYRIGAASLCWVGVASGADENARARDMADRARSQPCP